MEAPDGTPLLQLGIVPRLTDTPGWVRRRAPNPGEHNNEAFGELLGVSAEERAQLREADAI
ncbi:MAG: formyl-CoA transferase [Chloroflexi bacterium]|nr:MAG: formyl-CoA transferase [Chloroflexota bacterium]